MDLTIKDLVKEVLGPNPTTVKKVLVWTGAGVVLGGMTAIGLVSRTVLSPIWVPIWVWQKLSKRSHATA